MTAASHSGMLRFMFPASQNARIQIDPARRVPLQTITNPALVGDMINSLVTLAGEKDKTYPARQELLNT